MVLQKRSVKLEDLVEIGSNPTGAPSLFLKRYGCSLQKESLGVCYK